jgi:glycosyltransferase involved in cell wall biosynthesis
MITYNHEKYIAQSLDSVLMQKTDFEYELVIGEDASTDHTRDIIVECQNRYPEIIRLLPPAANMGVLRNMARTLKACRGQYVAVLEGDDYWTSPHKLQAQVNFLDSHPDYAICFHNSEVVYEAGYPGPRYWPGYWTENPKETSTIEDLLMNNFIPHSAVMFRNGLFGELPEWFYGLEAGDWAWNVLNAQHGKIGCLKEVMAVYRVHGESVWSSRGMERMLPAVIRVLDCFTFHFGYRYERVIPALLVGFENCLPTVPSKAVFLSEEHEASNEKHEVRTSLVRPS